MNLRPPGYEPDELPTALSRDINKMEGEGFEPSKAEPTDLQSVPFSHSGIPPRCRSKAGDGTRTRNLLITNQLLCQLSYTGMSHYRRMLFYMIDPFLSTLFLISFFQTAFQFSFDPLKRVVNAFDVPSQLLGDLDIGLAFQI